MRMHRPVEAILRSISQKHKDRGINDCTTESEVSRTWIDPVDILEHQQNWTLPTEREKLVQKRPPYSFPQLMRREAIEMFRVNGWEPQQ